MPNETGWTAAKPSANGFYWWRLDEHDAPEVEWITEGLIFGHGEREPTTVKDRRGEWLGPISPSDAEQLSELRRVLIEIRQWLIFKTSDGREGTVWPEWIIKIDAALAPKQQEGKETQ